MILERDVSQVNSRFAAGITKIGNVLGITFIIPVILSLFGLVIVRSATGTFSDGGLRTVIMQVIGFLLGCICAFFITKLNFRMMKHFGLYFFLGSFFLLALVLFIGSGDKDLGSKSWIKFGFVSFQPSEIVKVFFIIICAIFLERVKKKQDIFTNYLKLFVYAGTLIILILLQKDYGTAAVFIFIFIVMIFMTGVSRKTIIISLTTLMLAVPFAWFFLLNDARKDRFKVFLNPELDPLNAGYNVVQSKLAIGSGRIFGQGLFHGYLNSRGLVPVKESDFIFAVVGEELGFAGTVFVIIMFALLLYSILRVAKRTADGFQSLVCYGIFALFTFHFIENISMSIGLLPVTGLPLPFISQGGTALVSYFVAIGIITSVAHDKGA
jgi:rod shape determining protein RodA